MSTVSKIGMQVELPDDRKAGNRPLSFQQFQDEVQKVWDEHVRPELIFGRGLRFCRLCGSFYYQGDKENDHPQSGTESVQQFFGTAGLTSVYRLAMFLWSVYWDQDVTEATVKLLISAKHGAKAFKTNNDSSFTFAMTSKNQILEEQLVVLRNKLEKLEAEKVGLIRENEEAIKELLRLRKQTTLDYRKIATLSYQINSICQNKFECCCCCEEDKETE